MHTNGEARTKAEQGIRTQRRLMRAIFKEGVEAALRADPEVLEKCKPKTGAGLVVRGLVLEAAKCKASPLKIMMSLIDWDPSDDWRYEDVPDDTEWDWSPDGVWMTMPEPEPETAEAEQVEAETAEAEEPLEGPAKRELRRRLERLIEVGDHERAAKIIAAARAPEPYEATAGLPGTG